MTMDGLTLASFAAARVASESQDGLKSLIVAAGQNPTPESITAVDQAQVRSEVATRVLAKAIAITEQTNSDVVALMDQNSGLGQGFDTYA